MPQDVRKIRIPNWPALSERLLQGVHGAHASWGKEMDRQRAMKYLERVIEPVLRVWIQRHVGEALGLHDPYDGEGGGVVDDAES